MPSYEEHKSNIATLTEYRDESLHRRFRAVVNRIRLGARVLDIACGSGTLAAALQAKGCTVRGIDLAPAAVSIARSKGLDVIVGDVDDFERDEAIGKLLTAEYDAVIFSKCLMYLKNKNKLMRRLRTQSVCIIQTNPSYWKHVFRRLFGSARTELFERLPYLTPDGNAVDPDSLSELMQWVKSHGFDSEVLVGSFFRSRDLVLYCSTDGNTRSDGALPHISVANSQSR